MENRNYITGKIVPELLKQKIIYVKDCDENEFVNIENVEVKELSDVGFALTIPYSVVVTLTKYSERDVKHIFNLVVKITPRVPEDLYLACQFDTLFQNEETAYTEIFPVLAKNLKSDTAYPKYIKIVENGIESRYFYSEREKAQAVMVLGNFKLDGWRMSSSIINLDLNHILVAIRCLGKFHGECYALKESNHGLFVEIIKIFKESRFGSEKVDEIWDAVMKVGPKRGTQAVRERRELKKVIPESFLKKIEALCVNPMKYMKAKVQPREPLATICHGDFLRNNIAFLYDEKEPHSPNKAMMFDFQTLRYSSPMLDLTTFLANSTGTNIRSPNFTFIFKTYHEEVIKTLMFSLKKFRNEIPEIYSYDNFIREYANFQIYGYIIASSFLQLLHDPSEGIDLDHLDRSLPIAWYIQQAYKKGGEPVDYELSALIHDMYKLHQKLGIELE